MEARPHPLQDQRLRALHSYEILDTDRERDYDEVVQLAAAICDTPISVINLIDEERQWFKAEVGLGVRETPLETSLCAHAILEREFLEVPDTRDDPRMCDNPLCAGPEGLRFYAGALLVNDAGLPIGTLCVLDTRPRELTPLQRDALRVMARQVMRQIELRRALSTAEILRREVDHRVKNSLQSVSSLIRIQAREAGEGPVQAALMEVNGRIDSISALHEQLYLSETGGRIDLPRYLGHLVDHLRGSAPEGVDLRFEGVAVEVDSRIAASLGILLNEFAANAFKHAFPATRGGTLRCTLFRRPDGLLRLECRDDGGAAGTPGAGTGLGMRIAEAIARQIDGRIETTPIPEGMLAAVEFPEAA